MNQRTIKVTAMAAVLAIGSGCANMTPTENAVAAGALGGIAAGAIGRAAGLSTSESVAVGLAAGALVGATTYIIAKHQASERQRRLAEQRAYAAYQKRKVAIKKKKVRYIAVDTVKESNNKGAKAVMIYDTQTEKVVGNNVYDVKTAPAVGSTAKFETYSAEYVGSGA